jgi:hypothetical protein
MPSWEGVLALGPRYGRRPGQLMMDGSLQYQRQDEMNKTRDRDETVIKLLGAS